MHIEFNTTPSALEGNGDGEKEARGLVAMLVAMYGSTVLPAVPVVKAEYKVTPVVTSEPDVVPVTATTAPETDAAAAFGSAPVTTSTPDAATAFGAASTATTPAPAAAPVTGEVDKRGVPWDERIHSSTKAVTAKGEWQRRRNTPDDLFDSVMGELKARVSGQTQSPSAPPPPPPPPASVATTAAPAPSQTVVAPAASSTAPAGAGDEITFSKIMLDTMQYQREGKITKEETNNLLISVGGQGTTMASLQDEGKRLAFHALLVDHVSRV